MVPSISAKQNSIKKNLPNLTTSLALKEHPFLVYLSDNYLRYSLLLVVILFIVALSISFYSGRLFPLGEESSYLLSTLSSPSPLNPLSFPLDIIYRSENSGSAFLFFIYSLFIAIATVLLASRLLKMTNHSNRFSSFFFFLLLISPFFIYSLASLNISSLALLLLLFGFNLVFSRFRYLSIIPFTLLSFIDFLSVAFFLVLSLAFLIYQKNLPGQLKVPKRFFIVSSLSAASLFVLNYFLFHLPLIQPRFALPDKLTLLFSDLGSQTGISIFILILALVGFTYSWKKKEYFPSVLLLLSSLAYLLDTTKVYFLFISLCYFAAVSFSELIPVNFSSTYLKKICLFIIILGLAFTFLSYLGRFSSLDPTPQEYLALAWIQKNTPSDAKIYSTPENHYYLISVSQRESFTSLKGVSEEFSFEDISNIPHKVSTQLQKSELVQSIPTLNASSLNLTSKSSPENLNGTFYNLSEAISTKSIFPFFEKNKISYIYLNSKSKKALPQDKGLLAFLSDERFKMIYSTDDADVWRVRKETAQ